MSMIERKKDAAMDTTTGAADNYDNDAMVMIMMILMTQCLVFIFTIFIILTMDREMLGQWVVLVL